MMKKYLFLLLLILSACQVEIEKQLDLPTPDSTYLAKGVSATIPGHRLFVGYEGMTGDIASLQVSHADDASCPITILTFTSDIQYYRCREGAWKFTLLDATKESASFKILETQSFSFTLPPKEEEECFLSDDCPVNYHCFKRNCVADEVLRIKPPCIEKTTATSYEAVCETECSTCVDGVQKCWGGSTSLPDIKLRCVDCTRDWECVEWYSCKAYECVQNS